MKIPLFREIRGNIGSLTKTIRFKLYKSSLKKLKKSIDFSQKMWYYIIKERERAHRVPTGMADTSEAHSYLITERG